MCKNADQSKIIPFKQDLVNHIIWIIIFTGLNVYSVLQFEKGMSSIFSKIIFIISGFMLFAALFSFTKVLRRKYNLIIPFIIAFSSMFLLNFILLKIILQ